MKALHLSSNQCLKCFIVPYCILGFSFKPSLLPSRISFFFTTVFFLSSFSYYLCLSFPLGQEMAACQKSESKHKELSKAEQRMRVNMVVLLSESIMTAPTWLTQLYTSIYLEG